jgi:peroxiredoxin
MSATEKMKADIDLSTSAERFKSSPFIFGKDSVLSVMGKDGQWALEKDGLHIRFILMKNEELVASIISLNAGELQFSVMDHDTKEYFTLNKLNNQLFMNKLIILLTLLVFSIKVQAQTPSGPPPPEDANRGYIVKVGDPAPADLQMKLTDGTVTSLKALKGKVIVLQLTASYCSVCREKFPHLEAEIWQPLKNENFVMIAVDRDEPLKTALKFKKNIGITYPMSLDPGANIFALFAQRQSGISRDIVIDQNGRIVFLSRLYDPAEFHRMVLTIKDLLNNPPKA